ncbi:MAG: hypothetical protein M4579_006218 [Chaenotheca gracillima]|nr:MAG: hypothetical protein M4579_006218 [Chaenotheca gracillima]
MALKSLKETVLTVEAQPYAFSFPVRHTALLVVDMQRDFLLEGGFGEIQGGTLNAVQATIPAVGKLLQLFRAVGMRVFHTREGHKPDLSDCPASKLLRQVTDPQNARHTKVIGDKGKMGRLLIRGEFGHDIVEELQPVPGEVVIDKPGKGAFWNTRLMEKLQASAITHLVVAGVTTECCVTTTIREANDRGFEAMAVTEATAGYNPIYKECSLDMIYWSQGLFGFVGPLQSICDVLEPHTTNSARIEGDSVTPPQTPPLWDGNLGIDSLRSAYRDGLSVVTVVDALYEKIDAYQKVDPAVWIYLAPKASVIEAALELQERFPDRKRLPPLFGVPFSIKDSLDVKGLATTTACPPLAFIPAQSAVVYDRVISEGALFIGKTNLDQLATGLTGCRSPYGVTKSVFHPAYISGGSSSGSAVSVGADLVTFSIATDTAGSGRVPALFNGIVGFKPTRGTLSAQGLTPACESLDCIALMARTIEDTRYVWEICEGYDDDYVHAKATPPNLRHTNSIGPLTTAFRFGIPPAEALTVCTPIFRNMFNEAVSALQRMGGVLTPIDWAPFEKAGKLLYDGTFVSERMASLPDGWFDKNREHLHPVICEILERVIARNSTAVEAYRDLQAKMLYTRQAERVFAAGPAGIDILVVPTAPVHFTIDQVLGDPIATNTLLGTFTHFGNVLDLCGVSVPAGTYTLDEGEGQIASRLPFAVTFLGGSRSDAQLLELARRFETDVLQHLSAS